MDKFFENLIRINLLCVGFMLLQNICSCDDVDTNKDAKAIVDSKFDPKTISSILLYRTEDQCIAINKAIAPLNGGKPLVEKYTPLGNNKPYDDLIFALVSDSMTVFSMYLGHYLDLKDETFIIMIFIQIDDRDKFKKVYGDQHDHSFDDARRKQRHPFSNALAVWAEANRDPDKTDCISDTCTVGENLENERSSWNEKKRDQLEYVLMKESFKDSRSSVGCYGTVWADKPKRDLIKDITDEIKNHDLADLYTSLVRYVENGSIYLAQVLHDHCDGHDNWSMWIIILTTRRGDRMKDIDGAFQSQYKNVTLKDYIKTCNVQDPQLKDMLTILVDPVSGSKRQPPPPPPEPTHQLPSFSPNLHPGMSHLPPPETPPPGSPPFPSDDY